MLKPLRRMQPPISGPCRNNLIWRLALSTAVILAISFVLLPPSQAITAPFSLPASPQILEWGFLKDTAGTLRFEAVDAMPPERFSPLPVGLLSAGYTRAAYWIRFTVNATADTWYLDLLPPYLDDIQLYRADKPASGRPTVQQAGDHLPFSDREMSYRGFAFRMAPTGTVPGTFYLRVQTTSACHMVARVWSAPAFAAQSSFEAAAGFSALAILLTFLILNINHLAWNREPLQAWLCALLLSLILAYAATLGFSAQFIIPQHAEWNDRWIGLANMGAMAAGSGFHQHFFSVGKRQPFTLLLYRVGCWLPVLGVIALLQGHYPEIMPILFPFYFLLSLVGLRLSLGLLKRRQPGSLLAFLAAVSWLTGTVIVIVTLEGLLLGGLSLLYSMISCSIIQAVLLHLAVGKRYHQLEVEKSRETEKALRAQEDANRERAARIEQSDLFAMISHEIRTPLTMISGAVQSLEALVENSPDIHRRHERIRKAIWRIDALVEKTLDYDMSETQMGRANELKPLDLRRLMDEVIRQYELPGSRLSLHVGQQPCRIRGQRRLLEMLLCNLIDNALKYGDNSPIKVHLLPLGSCVQLEVRDGGPGVPSEQVPTLFNRYSRGAHLGDISGAGLGLYLVARIARWHGGEVSYDTMTTGGACFRILLPTTPPLLEPSAEIIPHE